ncbi:7TM diverse intracellular signaling domain-containing protein [Pseudomonas sp. LRF_L74]|uniref:7TM diverse intracellular signaling domain-containing protein n=1 Tax=Pseudomonas sp. LRF_L74 TaxID=3369422 RepID=UPI003F6402F2
MSSLLKSVGSRLVAILAFFVLSCSLLALPGHAAVRVDQEQALDLLGHADYLIDPTQELDLQTLIANPQRFHSSAGLHDLSFGYLRGAVWLRLEVTSAEASPATWLLEVDYPSLDHAQLFDVGADGVRHGEAGDMVALNQRSVSHRNPLFKVRLQPGESRTLYLHATSEGSMTLSGKLWPDAAFEQHSQNGYAVHSAYSGILFALVCYNLLLFIVLRERPFLYYVLFVAAFGTGVLSLNGLGPQYLWSGAGWWTNRALPIGFSVSAAIAILFTRSFLDTHRWVPHWDRWLRRVFFVLAIAAIATVLLPVQRALQTMSLVGIIGTLVLLSAGFVCVRHRVPGASLFVLAWGLLLLGVSLLALRNFAVLPSNFFTLHAMQIGSALEMILLSFALAARFNQHKRLREEELQEHERELEQRVAERTEALEAANQRLRAMAMKDPLTSLPNRNSLQRQMDMALRRAQRRQELLGVMLIDLDGFKPINDQLGHAAGDLVLVEVARRIQSCSRETDTPARLGGDEFVLVCETIASSEDAHYLAERMREVISRPIELEDGQPVTVGASIGVALTLGEEDSKSLMRRADEAMYAAKSAGRNRVHVEQP